jgi:hypothetical protein
MILIIFPTLVEPFFIPLPEVVVSFIMNRNLYAQKASMFSKASHVLHKVSAGLAIWSAGTEVYDVLTHDNLSIIQQQKLGEAYLHTGIVAAGVFAPVTAPAGITFAGVDLACELGGDCIPPSEVASMMYAVETELVVGDREMVRNAIEGETKIWWENGAGAAPSDPNWGYPVFPPEGAEWSTGP